MFDTTSRYAELETLQLTLPDGRKVSYKERRFLPQGRQMQILGEITLLPGERLDQVAARTLGDPEAYFRICDANDVMNPAELAEQTGLVLRVPIPQF